jgi:hypothetical protein
MVHMGQQLYGRCPTLGLFFEWCLSVYTVQKNVPLQTWSYEKTIEITGLIVDQVRTQMIVTLCSQDPSTGSYPEPDESNPKPHALRPIKNYPTIYVYV